MSEVKVGQCIKLVQAIGAKPLERLIGKQAEVIEVRGPQSRFAVEARFAGGKEYALLAEEFEMVPSLVDFPVGTLVETSEGYRDRYTDGADTSLTSHKVGRVLRLSRQYVVVDYDDQTVSWHFLPSELVLVPEDDARLGPQVTDLDVMTNFRAKVDGKPVSFTFKGATPLTEDEVTEALVALAKVLPGRS